MYQAGLVFVIPLMASSTPSCVEEISISDLDAVGSLMLKTSRSPVDRNPPLVDRLEHFAICTTVKQPPSNPSSSPPA